MNYIDVQWIHADKTYPVRLLSELDGERFETRKLEYFLDGHIGIADALGDSNETALGIVPVPLLTEINSDAQFNAREITKEEFETAWSNATR